MEKGREAEVAADGGTSSCTSVCRWWFSPVETYHRRKAKTKRTPTG